MISREYITNIRMKAIRRGVWFRILSNLDRGILNLSVMLLDEIHESVLGSEIANIIESLMNSLKSSFVRYIDAFANDILGRAKEAATKIGYKDAVRLEKDEGYKKYLTFLDFNQSMGYRRSS